MVIFYGTLLGCWGKKRLRSAGYMALPLVALPSPAAIKRASPLPCCSSLHTRLLRHLFLHFRCEIRFSLLIIRIRATCSYMVIIIYFIKLFYYKCLSIL